LIQCTSFSPVSESRCNGESNPDRLDPEEASRYGRYGSLRD
jgi:hypothetical protein